MEQKTAATTGKYGKCYKVFGKTIVLEFGKRAFRNSGGIQRIKNWTLWKGRPPLKRKRKLQVQREPVTQKRQPPPLVKERERNL
jgi:hypothetical protein